ncbi:MAG: Asp-tRNA(Asn)/Glu-tRNA(Gln) amidotransferase subunit GatC [Bacteroidetes bacterium]|nr:Asp-tRNA(Asn)/Glu-tRNA(Gln) amidotransferase subunit GatC [Bacteroidota bacterium]
MEIDDALISRLEKLARLKLDASERADLRNDLNSMLEMIEKLGSAELEGVVPLEYPGKHQAIPRKDEAKGMIPTGEALKNAPEADFPFFQVPKVIKK